MGQPLQPPPGGSSGMSRVGALARAGGPIAGRATRLGGVHQWGHRGQPTGHPRGAGCCGRLRCLLRRWNILLWGRFCTAASGWEHGWSCSSLTGMVGSAEPACWTASMTSRWVWCRYCAQSEVGSLQPLATMGAICGSRGIPLHSDGVQLCGKAPLHPRQLGVDLLTISAHKFCGPKGIGALIRNPRLTLTPLHLGGGQGVGAALRDTGGAAGGGLWRGGPGGTAGAGAPVGAPLATLDTPVAGTALDHAGD